MPRLALVLFIATLATSTSGLLDLALPEPCGLEESSNGQDDRDCAATCVRCTCCAQSIEIHAARAVLIATRIVADLLPASALIPAGNPSEVLHVPRPLAI